jgi:hypothetical protein
VFCASSVGPHHCFTVTVSCGCECCMRFPYWGACQVSKSQKKITLRAFHYRFTHSPLRLMRPRSSIDSVLQIRTTPGTVVRVGPHHGLVVTGDFNSILGAPSPFPSLHALFRCACLLPSPSLHALFRCACLLPFTSLHALFRCACSLALFTLHFLYALFAN